MKKFEFWIDFAAVIIAAVFIAGGVWLAMLL